MFYRAFKPEDFDSLYAIEEICFHPPLRFSRRYMRRLVDSRNGTTWIAEENGMVAGFAVADWTLGSSGSIAYLQTIEVVPEQRGRGVASELLKRTESSARDAGATNLWLHVDATNANAIRLYERRGYAVYGGEDHYYGPGRGALIYSKEIAGKDASEPRIP
jgi:ribosomal-protein-alanine N-acetyltransferase